MDLKIKDVVELLNVSESTIRRWLAEGKIPAYRINQQYRFNRGEIEGWLISRKNEAGEQKVFDTPDHETKGTQQFSLYRAIHKGGVIPHVPGKTKEEVIGRTTKIISSNLKLDADVLTDLLLDREKLQPTALNHGVGIPHTREFLLSSQKDVVTVVFPEHPLEYGALDGIPVHTLFFLFASNDKQHLHLLAKIAHLSSKPDACAFFKTKPNQEAFLDYIKHWEETIG